MKRYLKDFNFSVDFIFDAIVDCFSNNKWKRNDVCSFISYYAQKWLQINKNLNYSLTDTIKLVKKTIKIDKNRLFVIIQYIAEELYQEITERKIKLRPINYSERMDEGSGKIRSIGVASIKQQVYDYIVVNACFKMFNAKIGYYQCASIRNKGQLFGKKTIETWIRTNPRKCKYVFKADVKKYYPSVNHDKLKMLLKRDIKNDTILYVIYTLIDSYEVGLCIGSYLSQYLANYYLSYAYHYVSEKLYTERRGKRINLVNHILMYMDDLILFGSSKKNLKKASNLLKEYLYNKLDLILKPSFQLFKIDSRPIDMMGYKIYTYKTTIRKRIFKRAKKLFKKIQKNGYSMNLKLAQRVISYYGYFKYTYSYKFAEKINLEEIVKRAKGVVSYEAKLCISR